MNLADFIDRYREAVSRAVIRTYPPVYDAEIRLSCGFNLARLLRRPLGAQADAIRATALSLQRYAGTSVVGEMGVGKSMVAVAAAYLAGFRRVLILCPPHLVKKWRREVLATVPGARVAIVRTISDLGRARSQGGAIQFVICSREQAKLGYRWVPATVERFVRDELGGVARDDRGEVLHRLCCPSCFQPIADDEGVPLGRSDLQAKKRRCQHCGGALWQADRTGPRRFPLADYVRRRLVSYFDLLVLDECFPGDTPVLTPSGGVPIRALKPGDWVLSYRAGSVVASRVVRTIRRRGRDGLVRVTHSGGSFVCTPNHKIFTVGGKYAKAANLEPGTGLVAVVKGSANADHFQDLPNLPTAVHMLEKAQEGASDLWPQVRRDAPEPEDAECAACSHSLPFSDLRLVRRAILAGEGPKSDTLLRKGVCGGGAMGELGIPFTRGGEGAEEVGLPEERQFHSYESPQPRPCDTGEKCVDQAREGLFGNERGKWAPQQGATASPGGSRLGSRVCSPDRDPLVAMCPSGPGQSGTQDSAGMRRGLSPHGEAKQQGCTEDQDARGHGVGRASVLELGGHARSSQGPSDHQVCRRVDVLRVDHLPSAEEYVYDLEIEDTHCYFAAGILVSNCHEYKARGSAQGLAAAGLAGACGKTLALTGTVFGGYSSTLFYLLWRFSPAVRSEFGYRDEAKWVSRYGIVERITKKDPDAYADDGRHSKRRSYLTRTVEKPGVSPAILFHLIGNTVFLRLADVAKDLPPYAERVALFPLDRGEKPEDPSQASSYKRLAQDLWRAVAEALQEGSKRLLATYLQALLSYPDGCTRGETVLDPETGSVLAHAPALPEDRLYPKEQALVELVRRERERGRRVLVYITHTEKRDISPRLRTLLEREGFRVAVLKASTVAADRREDWVAARVRESVDVLICHPRLVQTGLDLVDWPSIVWYETEYSVYVMRQASRRSWRIGQRQPVEVTFFVYEGTLQAEALALVAAKMRSALMVEGELPEDGLAALEGDGQDVFLSLARRLTNQAPSGGQSLEALFAQTRSAEAEAEEFLVKGTWEPELEREDHLLPAEAVHAVEADLWTHVLSCEQVDQHSPAQDPAPISHARVVSLDELAALVRKPKPRRKPVPEGQLVLFAS